MQQRNIKLTLEYDGACLFGSQKQLHHRTVQSELERAFQKLFQKKIKVILASRTDSGVHAVGQVANFDVSSDIPLSKIRLGLNFYLPEDIAVVEIEEISRTFHSQYDAKWKTYEYRVWNSTVRPVLEKKRVFFCCERLNVSRMRSAARLLTGKHDFRAFEAEGSRRKSAVRTIRKFIVQKKGKEIILTVESNGFLYKMVRSLVGTLLSVGSGKLELANLKEALASKNRKAIGPTVPSCGLILKSITY
jgi:tRNA pseudouridine38-40 synthase